MYWIYLVFVAHALKIDEKYSVKKIAFGSCANLYNKRNPELFYSVANWNPDLFIWLGDIVYADFMSFPMKFTTGDLISWKKQYVSQKGYEEYKNLEEKIMITGIWDDHDYGIDDGNRLFPLKEQSKQMFLDFIDDGSVRNHGGIYQSFTFPNVKVILIDNRWFKDPKDDENPDTLGEEQWEWLEKELRCNSTIKIIVSGVQIYVHYRQLVLERWYDRSRERLVKIIDEVPGIILLSGDVHHAEIMKIDCRSRIFYEITSSGMTHTFQSTIGFLFDILMALFSPLTYNIGPKFMGKNFGTLEMNWEENWIEFAIRNSYGKAVNSHKINFSELYDLNEPLNSCDFDFAYYKKLHTFSVLVVFALPLILNSLALLIFLRKKSNSY